MQTSARLAPRAAGHRAASAHKDPLDGQALGGSASLPSLLTRYIAHREALEDLGAKDRVQQPRRLMELLDGLDPVTVTRSLLEARLDHLHETGRSGTTRNRFLDHARGFFAWMVARGLRSDDPTQGIGRARQITPEQKPAATLEELLVLCDNSPAQRAAVYALGGFCGLRRHEMECLWVGWVNLVAGEVSLPADVTKNKRVAHIPIPEVARPFLALSKNGRVPADPFCVTLPSNRTLRRDLVESGAFKADDPRLARFCLHALRTSLGTNLARAGVPPAIAQRIMRHASITTTMTHYTSLEQEDVSRWMQKLQPADDGNVAEPEARVFALPAAPASGSSPVDDAPMGDGARPVKPLAGDAGILARIAAIRAELDELELAIKNGGAK